MFDYYVGRLYFGRKPKAKFLGAFTTMSAAQSYAAYRELDMALNSVLFVSHNGETVYYSEPDTRSARPNEWRPFDETIIEDYSDGIDRVSTLPEVMWGYEADDIIKAALKEELTLDARKDA